MKQVTVQILLSTFNGEAWLNALWDSLLAQHWKNWQLLIRDDGSSDQSWDIIQYWQLNYPKKAIVLRDNEHVGSKESFNRLVAASTANYLCFCDQDDVWLPEKIQAQMIEMRFQERKQKENTPLLVHSDLLVTDEALNTVHSSFWRFRKFKIRQSKQQCLVQNTVTGCACLFNRSAAELAFPIPPAAMEHDRWLALSVHWFGYIAVLPLALVKYRQHNKNQIGAYQQVKSISQSVVAWSQQAEVFLLKYADQFNDCERAYLTDFASLHRKNRWQRRKILWKNKIRKQGFLPNIALLAVP